ncbi:MAG: HAD family phosphatase [Planctomycetaceae bacterium]|nr:HAD family phosphatase [Planctomycetaceae bacterium]
MPASDGASLAIFDHDGVLVDTLRLHQAAWVDYGERSGLPITPEFIHRTFGMTNPSILRLLVGDELSDVEIARHSAHKEECYRAIAASKLVLMDGVRAVLDALTDHGVLLAIGSSGARANIDLTVRRCGLEGRFAAITAVEDITRGKPDPQVFLITAERAGALPAHTVVFEDAPVGIQAAKAAGMYAVGVANSHPAPVLWDAGADEVIQSLVGYDVLALVERLRQRMPT